jgi:hypothetical protein
MTGTTIEIQSNNIDCINIEICIDEFVYGKPSPNGDPCEGIDSVLEYSVTTLTFDQVNAICMAQPNPEPITEEEYQYYLDEIKDLESGYFGEDRVWEEIERLRG